MTISSIKNRLIKKLFYLIFQYPRVVKYRILSDCGEIIGKPIVRQPVIMIGNGSIEFEGKVILGVDRSPLFYSTYGYIDVRTGHSKILIKDGVWINNNFNICSEGEGIEIGERCLIGLNFEISDSDFHDLRSDKRTSGTPNTAKVVVGNNVFIGNNVKILKGVHIGDNCVIANSSVVTKSFPPNVIIGGCPAKVVREIDAD